MIVDIYLFKPSDIKYCLRYYCHVKMFAILILHTLILHNGDNIAILPDPNLSVLFEQIEDVVITVPMPKTVTNVNLNPSGMCVLYVLLYICVFNFLNIFSWYSKL